MTHFSRLAVSGPRVSPKAVKIVHATVVIFAHLAILFFASVGVASLFGTLAQSILTAPMILFTGVSAGTRVQEILSR